MKDLQEYNKLNKEVKKAVCKAKSEVCGNGHVIRWTDV